MCSMATEQGNIILWGNNATCPFVQRVSICLKEKKIPFEIKGVNLSDKEGSIEFLSLYETLFPKSKKSPVTPLLQHILPTTQVLLTESDIILNYIEDNFNQDGCKNLMPVNAIDRAAIRMFIHLFSTDILPCVRKIILGNDEESLIAVVDQIFNGYDTLNDFLVTQKERCSTSTSTYISSNASGIGPFVLGSEFTLAESVIAPHIQRLRLMPMISTIRPQLASLLMQHTNAYNIESKATPATDDSDSDEDEEHDPLLTVCKLCFPALYQWHVAVLKRPSVVNTFKHNEVKTAIEKALVPWKGKN